MSVILEIIMNQNIDNGSKALLLYVSYSLQMYSVIEFLDENSVEVVPSSWIVSTAREKLCFWPCFKGKPLSNAILELMTPDLSTWKAHPCRVVKDGFGKITIYNKLIKPFQ